MGNELTLVCSQCAMPINPGAGCLSVSNAEVNSYLADLRDWREAHGGQVVDLGTLLAMRDEIPWLAEHDACTPAGRSDDRYTINSRQFRTWRHLTSWTAHLMGKTWLEATDWAELLDEVAVGRSGRIRVTAASAA